MSDIASTCIAHACLVIKFCEHNTNWWHCAELITSLLNTTQIKINGQYSGFILNYIALLYQLLIWDKIEAGKNRKTPCPTIMSKIPKRSMAAHKATRLWTASLV